MSGTTYHPEVATTAGIDGDEYKHLFSDRQRRATVRVINDEKEALSLGALATAVAGRVSASAEQLEARLHHIHLPMFDAADVVDYDPVRCRVEANSVLTELAPSQ